MKNLVSGNPEFVAKWHQICDEQEAAKRDWIKGLRAAAVVAAHPDDGWVNREENSIQFVYPQFNDGAGVGDIVALGWPNRFRLVRLTEYRKGLLTERWLFSPAQTGQKT